MSLFSWHSPSDSSKLSIEAEKALNDVPGLDAAVARELKELMENVQIQNTLLRELMTKGCVNPIVFFDFPKDLALRWAVYKEADELIKKRQGVIKGAQEVIVQIGHMVKSMESSKQAAVHAGAAGKLGAGTVAMLKGIVSNIIKDITGELKVIKDLQNEQTGLVDKITTMNVKLARDKAALEKNIAVAEGLLGGLVTTFDEFSAVIKKMNFSDLERKFNGTFKLGTICTFDGKEVPAPSIIELNEFGKRLDEQVTEQRGKLTIFKNAFISTINKIVTIVQTEFTLVQQFNTNQVKEKKDFNDALVALRNIELDLSKAK